MFLHWSNSYLICVCACVVSSHFTANTEGLIFSTMCKYYLHGFDHARTRDKVPLFISTPFWILSVNVTVGEKEHRVMITGWHTVADIFCVSCGSLVGWKYVQDSKLIHCKQLSLWWFDANSLFLPQEIAYDKSQKYQEGKFILERFSSFNV
jgi:hypothetical protein